MEILAAIVIVVGFCICLVCVGEDIENGVISGVAILSLGIFLGILSKKIHDSTPQGIQENKKEKLLDEINEINKKKNEKYRLKQLYIINQKLQDSLNKLKTN